ncbi:transcriptional regulator, MarR family with acetyltransferase activity [Stackebrandtia albiflava]|uniref:Transcriptional regulator, MarR family with acetyltransferase activity n=1 Tax=Stackebrandtia albiflava TaxID=406432 RepID=A0A562VDL1_9ACTN|nr:helix-turn-helix domain-containing GNAT family N-acetyltransferase [Stackebrandtia albiflava]TWJ15960.1 transcriptional regulator, MarR family with acetyltransferase activity [Stackebrandtia albiflava]
MADTQAGQIRRIREFNRFYTRLLGVLDEGLLDSPYSLTEVRVMYELRHGEAGDAAGLRRRLGLDAGYLSRMLGRLTRDGLVARHRDSGDGRRLLLRLTARGRELFDELDGRSDAQVAELVAGLGAEARADLLAAMDVIRRRFAPGEAPGFRIRGPRPGDLGRIVARNGEIYAREYGWNQEYEALVATIVADFATGAQPGREAVWIADQGGQMVGSVMCVAGDAPGVAKLRVLLVEPHARGQGVGAALIDTCLEFAASAGYDRIRLWTVDRLSAAARLYRRSGFEVVEESAVAMFGDELTAQTWERAL